MNQRSRRDDLHTLGLVDWIVRPDGALARARNQPPVAASHGALPESEDRALDVDVPNTAHDTTDVQPAARDSSPPDAVLATSVASSTESPAQSPSTDDNALSVMDWDTLEAWLAEQDHRGASRPVFGTGARDADVLIVGEAPGANEDAQGVPFVGRAGQLLDRMLFTIGCSRQTNVYITNICKFRPPDNRDPTADEVAADWPVLERQIDLMAPKLVVAVGRIAAQTLLASQEPLGKLRGQMHRYPQRELDVLVTYHPAYLLRSPQQKSKAWEDLRVIARHIAHLSAAAA